MLRSIRFPSRLVAALVLLATTAPPGRGSDTDGAPDRPVVADGRVEFPSAADGTGAVLTVTGPDGLHVRRDFPAGHPASFALRGAAGAQLPDGVYRWELAARPAPALAYRFPLTAYPSYRSTPSPVTAFLSIFPKPPLDW